MIYERGLLLNQLNAYSSALNEKSELSGTILSQIYDDVFENNKYPFVKGSPSLNDRRKVLLENHQINQYFIYLYQLLRNTRERLESNKSLGNEVLILKKSYGNIIRASMNTELLKLLAINILDLFDDYKNLIEEFNLFEHMPFTLGKYKSDPLLNLPLLSTIHLFKKEAFDGSIYLEEIQNNSILKIYLNKNEMDTVEKFSMFVLQPLDGKIAEISYISPSNNVFALKEKNYNKIILKISKGEVFASTNDEFSIIQTTSLAASPEGVILKLDNLLIKVNPSNPMVFKFVNEEIHINTICWLNEFPNRS